MIRFDTVIGLPTPVPVKPPGFDVAVKRVILLPPFEAGRPKLTVAWALRAVAVTFVGALGTVAKVAEMVWLAVIFDNVYLVTAPTEVPSTSTEDTW